MTDYAALLPPLTTWKMSALKAGLKANGQNDAVCVDETGNVLDGRHRMAILGKKNTKTKVIRGLSEAEKKAFVFRSNLTRRNLSVSQKKEAYGAMKSIAKELREENAKTWTQAELGKVFGVARETVRDWGFDKNTSIGGSANTCKPTPDARIKINPKHKPVIAERVAEGESQAQVAADYGVSQQTVSTIVKTETKKADETKKRKAAAKAIKGNAGIFTGDFREIGDKVADNSVSLIFTDPPYDKESASLYSDLSAFANRVLRPGGWCLAYSGQAHLPEVLDGMSDHLAYGWCFAIRHTGGVYGE